jgi:hypothetical protein
MTPTQLDALADDDFDGMLRLMDTERVAIEKENAKARRR